jgi:hypothetical protein
MNFLKKLFKKKNKSGSSLDNLFQFYTNKLVDKPVTENIIDRQKQFVMPTDPHEFAKSLSFDNDLLKVTNLSALSPEAKAKIIQIIKEDKLINVI